MKLIGQIELDLEEIFGKEDWDESIAEIIRDELRFVIRKELKEELDTNVTFVGAMKKVREKAAAEVIDTVVKWEKNK